MSLASHQLINQTSGDVEYYTPQPIIEAARKTLGYIQLDPASSRAANERVKAVLFFTDQTDGLARYWGTPSSPSTVWLNHPFSRKTNARWVNHLIEEYTSRRVSAACCITFAATSEAWFQPLLHFPQCFLCPRVNYVLPDGSVKKGVTKGSVVTYLGPDWPAFCAAFSGFGVIKVKA